MNAYRTEAEQIRDTEEAKKPRPWNKSQREAIELTAAVAAGAGGVFGMIQLVVLAVAELTWRSFLPAPVWFPALVFLVWYACAWWLRENEADDE